MDYDKHWVFAICIAVLLLPLAALMWFWQATVGLLWDGFGQTGGEQNDE